MKRIITYIFITLLCCNCKKESPTIEEINPISNSASTIQVSTRVIQDQNFNQQIIANGKTEALKKGELRFKTGNRIAHINVRNGQRVQKGEILAYLDNELLKNAVDKAQIALDKAGSQLEEEKINFGVSNKEEADINAKILTNIKFKSGIQEASNTLENSQLVYNQTILRAPFSGVVANLESKTGNYITSSDVFCTLISDTNMEVVFSVLEGEFNAISLDQEVSIHPFVNTSISYTGKISEINPFIDKNGLIAIKALITSKDSRLLDGMNVKVLINSPIQDVVVIPKQALVLRSNRELVFTVDKGLAKWNYVTITGENSTHYALKDGVQIGDTIIVAGNLNLSHGASVSSRLIIENR
ncbi:efflux RND transporter periplasmic adaptor subunit [Dokdonia sp.]|uniref:efflux RND transporter periplasmic adaptor subunit n=1 Tax=Dokdonia sp. TaxID=2024995 RepID=UPI0032668A88